MRERLTASLSHAAEQAAKKIELDLTRRLFLGGLAGSLSIFSKSSLAEQLSKEKPTTVSPEGIVRTVIENYANDLTGEEFKLVMTSSRPAWAYPAIITPRSPIITCSKASRNRNMRTKN